jgi:hypothetical protein
MILVPSSISSDDPPNLKLSTILFRAQAEMKLGKISQYDYFDQNGNRSRSFSQSAFLLLQRSRDPAFEEDAMHAEGEIRT